MNNKIISLLNKVGRIASQKETQENAALKRGEKFNIFEILGLQTDETRLHSTLIAELLNLKGRHGLGDEPLKLFLTEICQNRLPEFDTKNAIVEKEFFIGKKDEQSKNGGRIDILIRDNSQLHVRDSSQNVIVIENKIYAEDQFNQLYRYKNFAKKYKNNIILYLNLYGTQASQTSEGPAEEEQVRAGNDYLPTSYKHDIIPWLRRCRELAIDKPYTREILGLYLDTLDSLTDNTMNKTDKEELFKQMDEHIEATADIVSVSNDFTKYLVETYIVPELLEWAKEHELECKNSESFSTGKQYSGISFAKREWTKNIRLEFEKRNFGELIYGITGNNNPNAIENVEVAGLKKPNAIWHYGWCDVPQDNYLTPGNYAKIKDGTVAKNYIAVLDNLYNAIIEKEIDMKS